MKVNAEFLGFGLLVGQKKSYEHFLKSKLNGLIIKLHVFGTCNPIFNQ